MEGAPGFLSSPLYKEPSLTIVRQPQKRGYRFRYSSEGLTHGGIRGEPKPGEREGRIHPQIKLTGYRGRAKVVLTIVTANANESPHLHAHSLIVNKEKTKGYHVFNFDGSPPVLELSTVAIQHVVKEKLNDTLMDRILQSHFLQKFGWSNSIREFDANKFADLTAFTDALKDKEEVGSFTHRETNKQVMGEELAALKKQAEELSKTMNMNKCRLCFQVFLQGKDGHFSRKLEPVYSDIIYDGKTKHGAALKITRISKVTSSVSGDEEVWLIADKLHADDLEVRFFEQPTHGQFSHCWEGFGKFQKTDVLKQICLIFRTPEYHDKSIEQPVSVNMQLRRKSDIDCISEPHPFKYTPIIDRYGIGEKRKKEIPMNEILGFSQAIKKRPFESSCFSAMPRNSNPMTFNYPNAEFLTNMNMFSGNQVMGFNPTVVSSSTMNLPTSGLNFGNSNAVTSRNVNFANSTVVNSSGINFPITTALRPVHLGSSTVVNPSSVVSNSSVSNNNSISTMSTGITATTLIKEEGEEAVAVLQNETGDQLMDYSENSLSNDVNLARFEHLVGGQSESMINFLSILNQNDVQYE